MRIRQFTVLCLLVCLVLLLPATAASAPDPPSLLFSSFFGGSGEETGLSVAFDADGYVYLAGTTGSADLPVSDNAFDPTCGSDGACDRYQDPWWPYYWESRSDVFVAKFSPDGSQLIYSTYIGGSDYDRPATIIVDDQGYAYVAGGTSSPDFPTTSGAYDEEYCGRSDAFVLKLNQDGSDLVWSTFIGGSGGDGAASMALDADGNPHLNGHTCAGPGETNDFPTTPGAFDESWNGVDCDAFLVKMSADGGTLLYSTIVGSPGHEEGYGVAVDGQGNAYVTGFTTSADFPTTLGAFDTEHSATQFDGFVVKISPQGHGAEDLLYGTFLGGSGWNNEPRSVAVGPNGNAYVTGFTDSVDFPTTPGAYDRSFDPQPWGMETFVTQLSSDGTGLVYSTYIGGAGGSAAQWANAISVDAWGNAYVTGDAGDDFPTTDGSEGAVFVLKLDPTGSDLLHSTRFGQTDWPRTCGTAVAVGPGSTAYVAGVTGYVDFPTTPGAYDQDCGTDGVCDRYRPDPIERPDWWRHVTDAFVLQMELPPSSPVEQHHSAADELSALLPTGDSGTDHQIEKAIQHLQDSADPELWNGASALNPQHGGQVFIEDQQAVHELMKAGAGIEAAQELAKPGKGKPRPPLDPAIQAVIDTIIVADRTLAQNAIDEAIQMGGDAKSIAKAQQEMGKAQAQLDAGDWDKAIMHYRKAWEHAQKAVR